MIRSTICITEYNNKIITWLDTDSKMEALSVTDPDKDINKNIYVGIVKHVVKNINACFVEFQPGKLGFLSFNDIRADMKIVEGSNICVQVIKEASKNKEAVLTTKLSISGMYSVVEYSDNGISISKKINGELRGELKNLLSDTKYSAIVRTNAGTLSDFNILKEEVKSLTEKLDSIIAKAETRDTYSLVYSGDPEYINFIKSIPVNKYDRILTDINSVYDSLANWECELYTDDYPLAKLYSLSTKLEEILSKRCWLKSGSNIVIDYTEALTVIDVNSAKNISKKDREDNILKLNKEAAIEICRQLRLRNISGIIIIDFINMSSKEHEEELINYVKELLLGDLVRCDFVDMTKLGLMELVRTKIKPPIYEILKY